MTKKTATLAKPSQVKPTTAKPTPAKPKAARTDAATRSPAREMPRDTPHDLKRDTRDMHAIMAIDLPFAPLTPEVEAYFDICRQKLGFVPNVLQAYAHDMNKLDAFTRFYNDLMLAPSGLTKLEREMIAVAVSSENKCFYCLTAHGEAIRRLSGDPALGEMFVMNFRAADLTPKQLAMLTFAVKMTRESHTIVDADRDGLRAIGWSERDLWDIAAVASFFNMSNRMASAIDMRPNPEYHASAR